MSITARRNATYADEIRTAVPATLREVALEADDRQLTTLDAIVACLGPSLAPAQDCAWTTAGSISPRRHLGNRALRRSPALNPEPMPCGAVSTSIRVSLGGRRPACQNAVRLDSDTLLRAAARAVFE